MFKQKPFPASLLILAILLSLHIIGSAYSWYWAYPWFDIVVHLLSGVWVSLLFLWLASVLGQVSSLREYKVRSFLIAFISAILLGVIWELLESFGQITFTDFKGYGLDTAGDIINDGLGGLLAYLYFVKKRKNKEPGIDNLHPFYNQIGLTQK